MRCLPFLVAGILLFSGCLDFLDENNENRAPQAVADSEGGSNFEPNEEITFTGKGSNDPDGDVLEYFWDFNKDDEKDESIIGDITENGRTTHSYENEGIYTVTLTVTDGNEFSTATVKVTIQKPTSDIRAIVTTSDETDSVAGEEQVTFTFSATDSVSNSSITKFEWDFSYDSMDGFNPDEETTEPEISRDFYSGKYTVRVRITNAMGESDESDYSDGVELRINYEYSSTRTIDSDMQEHLVQVYGLPARYIRVTLEYETNSVHTRDLDLYLYNTTQEIDPDDEENENVESNTSHDNGDVEQVNIIELDYYNSTDRAWFDDASELGDWMAVVDHERTGESEYTIKIEVVYWE